MIAKALICLAFSSQTWADNSCQDETSLLQVSSAIKYGNDDKLDFDEAGSKPPAYRAPDLSAEGQHLKISWKVPTLNHEVQSTAVQLRLVGESKWKFVDSNSKSLVADGGNSVSAPSTFILVQNLQSEKPYEARVAMKNAHGWGDYSPTSEWVALEAPPMKHPARRKGMPRQENPKDEKSSEEEVKLAEKQLKEDEALADASIASTDATELTDKSSTKEIEDLAGAEDLEDLAGAEVTAEDGKSALEEAAKLAARDRVNARVSKKMHRIAVEKAGAKNQAAQEEVREKAQAAKAAIWEAHKANKTADKAAKEAQKADAAAEKATEAAEAAQAQKAALTLMLDAAEELAERTAEELQEVKKEG
jgi:hypothetical protein